MGPATCSLLATMVAAPTLAQDRPLSVDLTEVYRVGGVNAQDWAYFQPHLRMSFDGAGNLAVADALDDRVVVVGPDGELVRMIGRKGEGPGEFQDIRTLAVWRDGRVAVPDMEHSAIQVFSPDGELEKFVRLVGDDRPISVALGHEEIRADPLGDRLIAQGVDDVLVEMANFASWLTGHEEDEAPPRADDRALETLDLSGDVIVQEQILQGWRAPRAEPRFTAETPEDWPKVVQSIRDRYYEPGLHWEVLPDGTIAYSDSSAYAIKLASPDGSVIDVLRRPFSPGAVSGRIRQATIAFHLQRHEEWLANNPSSTGPLPPQDPEAARQRIRDRGFHDQIPVVRGIRATWDGGLWIQRRGEDPWDDEGPIDVFNADREYVGTLPPGDPAMPIAFGPDGLVVHLERDEFDVPTIVVSRIVGGNG